MRDIIIVDIETTGLNPTDTILEVAAINLATGREFYLAPWLERGALGNASFKALQINRYFERGVWEEQRSATDTIRWYAELRAMLNENTFAGSNPTFDSAFLKRPVGEVWHHRLLDLSAYAAGVLGTPPNELQGLRDVCEALDVVNEDPHSAMGDVRATAECFRRLIDWRGCSIQWAV